MQFPDFGGGEGDKGEEGRRGGGGGGAKWGEVQLQTAISRERLKIILSICTFFGPPSTGESDKTGLETIGWRIRKLLNAEERGWIKTIPGDNWDRGKREGKTGGNGKSDKMT